MKPAPTPSWSAPADAAPGASACTARRHGKAPWGHWQTTTFVGSLRAGGITAPMVIDGAMNGPAFFAYVHHVLAPSLTPGDIVVLGNLGARKVAGVRAAIEAAGATVQYLPPYSPDLNPIELAFAKLKRLLRKAATRTKEALHNALAQAIDAFTPAECSNYFRHDGYASTWPSVALGQIADGRERPGA
jgi:transposase